MLRAKRRKMKKIFFRAGLFFLLLSLILGIRSWISPTIEEKHFLSSKGAGDGGSQSRQWLKSWSAWGLPIIKWCG